MTNGRGQNKGKNQQANNSQPIVKQMTSMNSNTTKAIKSSIVDQNPYLAEFIEQLFSLTLNDKPVDIRKAKFNDSIEVLVFNEQIWFYRPEKNAPFLPTLHFAHCFPQIFPQLQTDDNAAGFILNGADVMARGIHKITNPDIPFSINNTIAVRGFSHEHSYCIGTLLLQNFLDNPERCGKAVEVTSRLGDEIWQYNARILNKKVL